MPLNLESNASLRNASQSKTALARMRWAGTCPASNDDSKALELTSHEGERFVRIVADSLLIRSHYELCLWLNGEMRQFLPHQILIAAWGDFTNLDLEVDVISGLPRVRTEQIAQCRVADVVRACYARWVAAGRKPLVRRTAEVLAPQAACPCAVHGALGNMRSLLVHGVRDERNGHESLYIALDSGVFGNGWPRDRFISLVPLLIDQLDVAVRKVAAFPLHSTPPPQEPGHWLDLSAREREILDWLRRGKTNIDIAAALDISPFTVKNHVQRIFRKLAVCNRTQAAAKYNEAVRGARSS